MDRRHVLQQRQLYFFSGTLAERITVPTNGTVGSGFATIILQSRRRTGFGAFADRNRAEQHRRSRSSRSRDRSTPPALASSAKWKIPGNEAGCTIAISGPTNQAHFSFDKVMVDTLWSATGYQGDSMAAEEPAILTRFAAAVGGIGTAYSVQLSGEKGNAPYSYSVSAGTLPDGLSLSTSGLLDGTPTTAGTSSFTVLLTDANGADRHQGLRPDDHPPRLRSARIRRCLWPWLAWTPHRPSPPRAAPRRMRGASPLAHCPQA